MRHIISILLQNEAGALARVAALFSTRGFNIESLSVAPTEHPEISRMTLVTIGSDAIIDQINEQLLKLVDVVNVADMTLDDHIERELLPGRERELLKLSESASAKVLDDSPETYTLELIEANEQIDDFISSLAANSEIISVVRSGAMAIARGHNVLA